MNGRRIAEPSAIDGLTAPRPVARITSVCGSRILAGCALTPGMDPVGAAKAKSLLP